MKAVIYLDSYFFMNLLLNGMILHLLRRIRKLQGNPFRILLAAAFGALVACLLVLHPFCEIWMKGIITYLMAGGGMILLAFGYHGRSVFWGNLCCLVAITIGLGGIVQFLTEQYLSWDTSGAMEDFQLPGAGMVFIMALLGSAGIHVLYQKVIRQAKRRMCICSVVLFLEDRKITVTGYLDSGNMLKDPVSGKSVAVLEKESFLGLFEGQNREEMEICFSGGREQWEMAGRYLGRMRLIPYKSIGKARGLMNGFVADRMEMMTREGNMVSMRPVIAVYSGTLSSDGSYQMILPATS